LLEARPGAPSLLGEWGHLTAASQLGDGSGATTRSLSNAPIRATPEPRNRDRRARGDDRGHDGPCRCDEV